MVKLERIVMKLCLAFVDFYRHGNAVHPDTIRELEHYGKYGE